MIDPPTSDSEAEKLHHILYQFEQKSHKHRIYALSEKQLTTKLVTEKAKAVAAIQALTAQAEIKNKIGLLETLLNLSHTLHGAEGIVKLRTILSDNIAQLKATDNPNAN
jgi:hypothetical protein